MSSANRPRPSYILPVIVFAQFAGTSLWFAGNAVLPGLQESLGLLPSALGHITTAVQLGFIFGTLVFAIFTVADRFSPSRVFLVCALLGAVFNMSIAWLAEGLWSVLIMRFLTGFFLAGIYPVGMKIASDWYEKGLGKALGYLVGALVLGTAFPHLLRGFIHQFPWEVVLILTSILAASGGLLLVFTVGDGPNRVAGQKVDFSAFFGVFNDRDFRAASFGYFGHMWELYAFWAFVPLALQVYQMQQPLPGTVSYWSFTIIGIGALSCIIGGYLSQRIGSGKVAIVALLVSGICCVFSPWFYALSPMLFLGCLLLWGLAVIADSPQFSTLVAQTAPAENRGTALTIVNAIGFAITIPSIQLLNTLAEQIDPQKVLLVLVVGPVLGLIASRKLFRKV